MAGDLRHLDPESPSLVQYEIERWGKGAQPSGAPYKSWIERGAEFEAATTPEKLIGAHAPAHHPSCGWVQFGDGRVAETGECVCFGVRIPSLESCMKHARETVERLGPNPNAHEVAREAAKATREFILGAPASASYGGIPIVSDPSLRPGEIVAMSAGKEVGRIVDVPPASAHLDAETITRIYTSGYRSGHHDTVEGCYTDVHPSEEGTYLREDAVAAFAALPASAQGEVCECGHIAAIHDDPHGDGAHGGSCLEIIGKCSDGSDDFCCCSEFHHAQ